MTAGVAAGWFPTLDAAAAALVRVDRVLEPDATRADAYDELYARYVDLYARLNG
jgi:sugar (pentulose or hexulose) kinase